MAFSRKAFLEVNTGGQERDAEARSRGPPVAQRLRITCELLEENYYEKSSHIVAELNVIAFFMLSYSLHTYKHCTTAFAILIS